MPYEWFNIDADEDGLRVVEQLQGGGRTIPTIVFADGSYLLEPTDDELAPWLVTVFRKAQESGEAEAELAFACCLTN